MSGVLVRSCEDCKRVFRRRISAIQITRNKLLCVRLSFTKSLLLITHQHTKPAYPASIIHRLTALLRRCVRSRLCCAFINDRRSKLRKPLTGTHAVCFFLSVALHTYIHLQWSWSYKIFARTVSVAVRSTHCSFALDRLSQKQQHTSKQRKTRTATDARIHNKPYW